MYILHPDMIPRRLVCRPVWTARTQSGCEVRLSAACRSSPPPAHVSTQPSLSDECNIIFIIVVFIQTLNAQYLILESYKVYSRVKQSVISSGTLIKEHNLFSLATKINADILYNFF